MEISDKTDYHLHTYYSDGVFSPAQVVSWAHEKGLERIAITDHDGVEGIEEAEEAAKKYDIDVTPGIEFSTATTDGVGIHMLGYGIDTENRELLEACEDIRKKRKARNDRLIGQLVKDGYDISMDDLITRPGQDFVGKPIIARALVRKGYIKNVKDAFDDIFSRPEYRSIKKKKILVEEAMKIIIDAGGRPVLAHPALIRGIGERGSEEFKENAEAIIQRMLGHGLWGIETYYPKFTEEETEFFREEAEKYDLTPTKGSDYHGDQ